MTRRTAGTVIALLLLFSVFSGIYLVSGQKAESARRGVSVMPQRYIGVVDINGPIFAPSSPVDFFSTGSHEDILKALRSFRDDSRIRGVILRINSPGGTVGAVQEINAEIARLKEEGKPVVASISDMGASGGYYIAASCDKIIANPGSILGSIGVIMTTSDMSELLRKIGVSFEVVKSGDYKDTGSFHRPVTDEEKDLLQGIIDNAYNQFVNHVSEGRDLTVNAVRELARGQLYTGEQAFGNSLIDYLGDFEKAHLVAEELAGLKNTAIIRSSYGRWTRLFGIMSRPAQIDLSSFRGIDGIAYLYKHP